ncbi:MAG: glycerophosphodiester phosphodiesterase family protein [Massilibacteroides sp.]|nr:glycerophosphodiester phosphodiesterase family protein [Massilibacteroides sp.]MDD4114449.1 glycerophosphodiester phosphodiesterase family protein [Massilibacteroides sp.]
MKKRLCVGIKVLGLGVLLVACGIKQTEVKQPELTKVQQSFRYTEGNAILVSGHRGGRGTALPENSLETLQAVTERMPVFFEIDPRLTKDSVIVLMHDETLDRTTNGTGKVSDYTWEELQKFNLKDSEGALTASKIPLLKEVLLWSKGKTILNLDKKDVPVAMIVDLIKACDAEELIMLTVHTGAQARYYYDRFSRIMFSAFIRNEKEYEDMEISGVPWANMIAYIGQTINEKNDAIVKRLHEKGVKCMISVAPTQDALPVKEDRLNAYAFEIAQKPDIIESDYPLDVWSVLTDVK